MASNNECRMSADISRPASHIFSTISRAVATYDTENLALVNYEGYPKWKLKQTKTYKYLIRATKMINELLIG